MKKKVIFVTKALWVGGIETALINLLNQLDYERYEVTLLILKAELNLIDRIPPACRVIISDREQTYTFTGKYRYANLYHFTEKSTNPSTFHKLLMWTVPFIRWGENRLYIRYVRKFMRDEHFDTCIIYSDVVAELAVRSISADQYYMFYHHGGMRHVYHDAIAYKRCKKIIAVSNNQAEELIKYVPAYADKIISIHNFTDVDGICQKATFATREQFDSSKFNIVSVGRVSEEKGMDLIIESCANLVQQGYKNICWWLVGDGPAMNQILNLIKELHMEDYIIPVGMQKNPYPYMRQADLYVQPSRIESFGLTIIEALCLNKHVVSTSTAGGKEILNGLEGCLLCNIDSVSITEAVKVFIDSEQANVKDYHTRFLEENKSMMKRLEKLL